MERPHWDRASQICLATSLGQSHPTTGDFLCISPFEICLKIIASSTDSSPSLCGELIADRYQVGEELGRGGIGSVFLAYDLQLHRRPVVIKFLSPASTLDTYLVTKFKHEVEALSRLDHPGIVKILGASQFDSERQYILMEHLAGPTLRHELSPHGLGFSRIASIIRQLGAALDHVHCNHILHLDLKPENIMLPRPGDGSEVVKLVDFGLAKITNSIVDTVTSAGATAGTFRYLSPEQLRGEQPTARSDIYSMGIVAFEMLTGRRPFDPCSHSELLKLQSNGVKLKPIALRPRMPRRAQEIVLKALSFNPRSRYQTAGEFGNDLARALQPFPLERSRCAGRVGALRSLDVGLSTRKITIEIQYRNRELRLREK